MKRRAAVILALAALAAVATGCGALPPEAPVPVAGAISRALTTIASSCGEAYRLQAFSPHPDLSGLEATAGASARRLAPIVRRHPRWIYESDTLTEITQLSAADLRACALPGAAAALRSG